MPENHDIWFKKTLRKFGPATAPFAGRPICYVEIGCWAGSSSAYVAKNVLTHPAAIGYGIDPYLQDLPKHPQEQVDRIKKIAFDRLEPHRQAGKWNWIYEPSQEALRTLNVPIDLFYIDGSHRAHDVLQDFVLGWHYLRPGSVVIFDDIGKGRKHESPGKPNVPTAVEAVMSCFGHMLTVLNRKLQFVVRVDSKG